MVLYVVQSNPLKQIAVGPDYKYRLRQSTHLFMFYTLHCVYSYSSLATVNVAGSQIPLADHIKILGITLDKNLSMNNHVNAVCKSIHYLTGPILSVFPALIVHSELKSVHPGFPVAFIF